MTTPPAMPGLVNPPSLNSHQAARDIADMLFELRRSASYAFALPSASASVPFSSSSPYVKLPPLRASEQWEQIAEKYLALKNDGERIMVWMICLERLAVNPPARPRTSHDNVSEHTWFKTCRRQLQWLVKNLDRLIDTQQGAPTIEYYAPAYTQQPADERTEKKKEKEREVVVLASPIKKRNHRPRVRTNSIAQRIQKLLPPEHITEEEIENISDSDKDEPVQGEPINNPEENNKQKPEEAVSVASSSDDEEKHATENNDGNQPKEELIDEATQTEDNEHPGGSEQETDDTQPHQSDDATDEEKENNGNVWQSDDEDGFRNEIGNNDDGEAQRKEDVAETEAVVADGNHDTEKVEKDKKDDKDRNEKNDEVNKNSNVQDEKPEETTIPNANNYKPKASANFFEITADSRNNEVYDLQTDRMLSMLLFCTRRILITHNIIQVTPRTMEKIYNLLENKNLKKLVQVRADSTSVFLNTDIVKIIFDYHKPKTRYLDQLLKHIGDTTREIPGSLILLLVESILISKLGILSRIKMTAEMRKYLGNNPIVTKYKPWMFYDDNSMNSLDFFFYKEQGKGPSATLSLYNDVAKYMQILEPAFLSSRVPIYFEYERERAKQRINGEPPAPFVFKSEAKQPIG